MFDLLTMLQNIERRAATPLGRKTLLGKLKRPQIEFPRILALVPATKSAKILANLA